MTSEDRDDFEAWCLGSCFLQPIADRLRLEVFSDRGRRILLAARSSIASGGCADIGLVEAYIRSKSNGTVEEDLEYVAGTLKDIPKSANWAFYHAKLEAEYRKKQASAAARAAATAIEDGETPNSVLEHLEAAKNTLTESIELPEPLNLTEIMAGNETEPVPWAVSGLFAKHDILVIGGEGGTGKSILALDLAIALSTGQQFLGMQVMEPQPVLYLDEENQTYIAKRRIRQHLLGRDSQIPPKGLTYLSNQGLTYHSPQARAKLAHLIDTHQPAWVVLDSYVRFRGGDENSNTDAAEFAAALKGERIRSGVGWIILTHLAKPSKDRPDPVHRIRGASDIVNSSDALLTLEGDRQTERRTLTPQQRRTATLAPMEICWRESEDEQSAQLLCLGGETRSGEDAVKRSLRLAETAGVLRADLEAIVEHSGYSDPRKASTRILGKLIHTGQAVSRREGKQARYWLAEYATMDTNDGQDGQA